MKAYRIFENRRGHPCTLFHGLSGTRTLQTDVWIQAVNKPVTNPGKKDEGQVFTSGFHVCRTRDQALGYLKRFKHNRSLVVCRVEVKDTRPKPGSKILLADEMLVSSRAWEYAKKESTRYENQDRSKGDGAGDQHQGVLPARPVRGGVNQKRGVAPRHATVGAAQI